MNTSHELEFREALQAYRTAATAAFEAEEKYRLEHARALLASEGKNEAARKADADTATSELRRSRSQAAIELEVAQQMLRFVLAQTGKVDS